MPVAGFDPRSLWGSFTEARGTTRAHEAVDLPAPRGTPVLAVADGIVQKLFTSVRGGLTLYEFDLDGRYCYYYAHLDSYAPSILEGRFLRKGDVIGTVGSTGNANEKAPHLHFAVTLLGPEKKWWGGVPVDPYPLLVR
ncbi:MAG: M23 family metallopeptidase [Holophagales bacterium]|nr:M23 family metallopeptidase [Holophagales bacterium]MBK9964110.1 M23 family metallopeptidase [Holophagales bacterium]